MDAEIISKFRRQRTFPGYTVGRLRLLAERSDLTPETRAAIRAEIEVREIEARESEAREIEAREIEVREIEARESEAREIEARESEASGRKVAEYEVYSREGDSVTHVGSIKSCLTHLAENCGDAPLHEVLAAGWEIRTHG